MRLTVSPEQGQKQQYPTACQNEHERQNSDSQLAKRDSVCGEANAAVIYKCQIEDLFN